MAIDIGSGATDRAANTPVQNSTYLDYGNPANADGIINTIEIFFVNVFDGLNVKVGTFFGSGTSWTVRSFATLGTVTKGSKQTFSSLNIECRAGDVLGVYFTQGAVEEDTTGGAGVGQYVGDAFAGGQKTYTTANGAALSLYGTGIESLMSIIDYHFNHMR